MAGWLKRLLKINCLTDLRFTHMYTLSVSDTQLHRHTLKFLLSYHIVSYHILCHIISSSEKDAHILFPCRHTNIHTTFAYQQILGEEVKTCGYCRGEIVDHGPLSDWLAERAQGLLLEKL